MSAAYVSVKELAEKWGCHPAAIYKQVDGGRLAALRIGQTIRIPLTAVADFERANTTGQAESSARRRA